MPFTARHIWHVLFPFTSALARSGRMAKGAGRKPAAPAAADLLIEPSLLALRKHLASSDIAEEHVAFQLPADASQPDCSPDAAEASVLISGAGATDGGYAASSVLACPLPPPSTPLPAASCLITALPACLNAPQMHNQPGAAAALQRILSARR